MNERRSGFAPRDASSLTSHYQDYIVQSLKLLFTASARPSILPKSAFIRAFSAANTHTYTHTHTHTTNTPQTHTHIILRKYLDYNIYVSIIHKLSGSNFKPFQKMQIKAQNILNCIFQRLCRATNLDITKPTRFEKTLEKVYTVISSHEFMAAVPGRRSSRSESIRKISLSEHVTAI